MYVEEPRSSQKLSEREMTVLNGLSFADAVVIYYYVHLVFAFTFVGVFSNYNYGTSLCKLTRNVQQ
jgi:hypothetical protein